MPRVKSTFTSPVWGTTTSLVAIGNRSCHAFSMYVPGGTFVIVYAPLASDSANHGFSKTRITQFMVVWIEQKTSTRPGLSNGTRLTSGDLYNSRSNCLASEIENTL